MTRLFLLLSLFCASAFAQGGLQPIPALSAHVVDTTNTLDAIELKGLDDKLFDYEKRKGTQIAILIVATTQPEDNASYANRVANQWKIGRKGVGDGVLVVVAKDDHKVRIEVAKSLEGAIPDLAAKQVIDGAITPNFKKGDFAAGLRAAADQLIARIDGEKLPEPKRPKAASQDSGGGSSFSLVELLIFGFIFVPIVGKLLKGLFGQAFGSLLTGVGVGGIGLLAGASLWIAMPAAVAALLFSVFTSGMPVPPRGGRGGGGWGGGFGGGGFGGGSGGGSFGGGSFGGGGGGGGGWGGSGGGGDFGGGGASGDW